MIIRELKLDPFAGLFNQALQFSLGLNVVLGPNEAGKSTVVNALKMAMFMPTQYTTPQFKNEISRYMPLTGGDTIQVELAFTAGPEHKAYLLFKSWGAKKESRLVLPDGGLLTGPQEVQEKLRELLVLKEGTYHAVLFAYQSHLGATLAALRKEPEPRHNLADLLRRAIYETDGVPVDLLEQRLDERLNQCFSRWDQALATPQGNRGIENRWAKGVGEVLQAYYQKEELRLALQSAREYESQLDALNERVGLINEELESLRKYVETNQLLVEDGQQRRLLEAKLKVYQGEESQLKELFQKWPVLEKEVKEGPAALEKLRKTQTDLEAEFARAQAYEAEKDARNRFTLSEKRHTALKAARDTLAGLKEVTAEDLQALEGLNLQLVECRASLKAGALSLEFTPAVPMTVQAVKDLEAASEYVLHADQHLELDAGGFISLCHPDWQLAVKSGQVNFKQLDQEFKKATNDFQYLLQRVGVKGVASAKQAHEAYSGQVTLVKRLDEALTEILAGQTYEALQAAGQKDMQTPPPRPSNEVALEVGGINTTLSQAEQVLAGKREELTQLQKAHGSLDGLIEKLADTRGTVKKFGQELAQLKTLPPEITDLDAFIDVFDEKETLLQEKQEDWHKLLLERSELQARSPDETAEEIVPQLQDAENRLAETLTEGAALNAVQSAFAQVKGEMDGQTLAPWLHDLQQLLATLTGGRYLGLELEGEEALRQDGLKVPGLLLSGGAKVSFGLAVRLSMASHFLHGLDGFLVMDDPLVDLDDVGRQQAAVQVIQEFAKEKQVIVLTCKEGHAELLGGHRIDLQRAECR